jgi:hypothetical protein
MGEMDVQLHALLTSTLGEILGFRREADEKCALLGYYAG